MSLDNFHDDVPLPMLFEVGQAKFTPLISLGRLLQLHRYAKENGCVVSYFEAFEVKNGLEYTNTEMHMMGFPDNISTSQQLTDFVDKEMALITEQVSKEENTYGFVVYVESSIVA
jgi:hypothetical protein